MIKKIIISSLLFVTVMSFALSAPLISFADTVTINDSKLIRNPVGDGTTITILITRLLQLVAELGAVVCIFFIIYSGFLFIKAQGDSAELTKAKSVFFWSIIGAAVLLGASVIAELIRGTVDSVIRQ